MLTLILSLDGMTLFANACAVALGAAILSDWRD